MRRWLAGTILCWLAVAPAPAGAAARGDETGVDLDAWIRAEMAARRIPALVLAVVDGGRVARLAGYRVALPGASVGPVDPRASVFRVGSLSKLVTAIAVLRLAEAGLVDLRADVRRSLRSVRLEAPEGVVVTAEHLLTHTAGLEERYVGIARRSPTAAPSLRAYLESRPLRVVLPPGRFAAYSNHGFALAGLLVEEVTGIGFERYVEEAIFAPLGMTATSFGGTGPDDPRLVPGYRLRGDRLERVPFDTFLIGPAASLETTAADMARLLLALLGHGPSPFESAATRRELLRRRFAHHPALAGRAYALHERFDRGRRALAHAGGIRGYASYLYLLPDEDWGFFVAYDRLDEEPYEALRERLLERRFPAEGPPPARPPRPAIAPERDGAGAYRSYRTLARGTFDALLFLFSEYRVLVEDGAVVVVPPDRQRPPSRFVPVGDGVYEEVGGPRRLVFLRDAEGRVTHMAIDAEAFEKLAPYEEARLHRRLFSLFTLVFQAVVLLWPVAFVLRLRRRRAASASGWPPAVALLGFATSLLGLGFLTGLGAVAARIDPYEYVYGMPPAIETLLVLPLAALALAAVFVPLAVRDLLRREGTWLGRACLAVLALVLVGFFVFLDHWNLLGFRY